MFHENYSVSNHPISVLLGYIEANEIAIPEIQRPFVWKRSQVRDLIDSLYNGYPTGYIITWKNPNVKLKDGSQALGKKVLIDGQQRVTALMASISGKSVLNEDYEKRPIRIAFNPLAIEGEEKFAVQDSSHLKSKKWIPDISYLFKHDFDIFAYVQEYCNANPEMPTSEMGKIVSNLKSIANRQVGIIELSHNLEIDKVTDIFIRINNQGTSLSQADFAMSKIASDEKNGGFMLRKAIDYFCHLAVKPEFYTTIEVNDKEFMSSEYAQKLRWLKDDKEEIYDPDYANMLRVSFMHTFSRAKIADLVALLSGRDFETREFKEEIAEDSFTKLKIGVLNFMSQYNFSNFVLALKSAGFVSPKLLNSTITVDFAYNLYLLLNQTNEVPKTQIAKYVKKWYVLSTLTSRYTASPESAMDRDLRNISSKGFLKHLEDVESATLSNTFWDIGLVQNLETSSRNSPAFNVFIASQIFFKDSTLFVNGSHVSDLVTIIGDIHHIFPKSYLTKNGVTNRSHYNQVANYIYLDTNINKLISDRAPHDYFGQVIEQSKQGCSTIGNLLNEESLRKNLEDNCIPYDISNMDVSRYDEFLLERRKLMAKKIERFYKAL